MNTPYESAAEAVEFWRKAAYRFGYELEVVNGRISVYETTPKRSFVSRFETAAAFTRDMLARCVLCLAERGAWIVPVQGVTKSVWFIHMPNKHPRVFSESSCIVTVFRDAVLAVAKEIK